MRNRGSRAKAAFAPDAHIWSANNASYPGWVEVRLPSAQSIDRVVVYAGVLWQADGSILDYQLQVIRAASGSRWIPSKSR